MKLEEAQPLDREIESHRSGIQIQTGALRAANMQHQPLPQESTFALQIKNDADQYFDPYALPR